MTSISPINLCKCWKNQPETLTSFTQAYGKFFARGGGKSFAQKISQVAQLFTKEQKTNEGHIATTWPSWHMKVARYSFSGSISSLSINYVAINKHLEYCDHSCIKTKICHYQGCNDIGVVIATKCRHYLLYLQHFFSL